MEFEPVREDKAGKDKDPVTKGSKVCWGVCLTLEAMRSQ